MEQEIKDFLSYMTDIKNVSENTRESYRLDLTKLERYMKLQGITSVQQLTATTLNSYILYLEKNAMAPSSISRNIASIHSFVKYLLREHKLEMDIAENLKAPKLVKKMPEILTLEEVHALVRAAKGHSMKARRDYAMIVLLCGTGIRVGELIMLKKRDINLDLSYLTCTNDGRERTIPFDGRVGGIIKEYLDADRNMRSDSDDDSYLFTNMSGTMMSRQGFWKLLKQYAKKAGIEKSITPNMIRHTYAILCIRKGKDLDKIQDMLGNSDASIMKNYIELASRTDV